MEMSRLELAILVSLNYLTRLHTAAEVRASAGGVTPTSALAEHHPAFIWFDGRWVCGYPTVSHSKHRPSERSQCVSPWGPKENYIKWGQSLLTTGAEEGLTVWEAPSAVGWWDILVCGSSYPFHHSAGAHFYFESNISKALHLRTSFRVCQLFHSSQTSGGPCSLAGHRWLPSIHNQITAA